MFHALYTLFLSFTFCTAWNVDIERYSGECFYERVKVGDKMALTFEVTEGGFLDIDVEIKGPDGSTVYNGERESSGKYTFSAYKEGKYQFCFNNHMSGVFKKRVLFDVIVDKTPTIANHSSVLRESVDDFGNRIGQHDSAEPDTVYADWSVGDNSSTNQSARLTKMVDVLSLQMDGVFHEQNYLLARNVVHMRLSENTNSLVAQWALFEVLIIVIGSAFQVWYIKRFFEVRRVV